MNNIIKLFLFFSLFTTYSFSSRIVSIGGSITETLAAFGVSNELVGVDLSSSYPKHIVNKLPKIGYWLSLPMEGILSLKPDVVFISSKAKPTKIIQQLPTYGIKTYIIHDEFSIESAKHKINQIGIILNKETKAIEFIQRIEKNILKIDSELKNKKNKPKVLFLFSMGKGNLLAAGSNTKAGVMIELAGGQNVIDFKQYSKVSNESILKMNPDVIIYTNHKKKKILKKNIIMSTTAGINSKVFFIDMLFLTGFTVRIDEALEDLTCKINNNEFSFCR